MAMGRGAACAAAAMAGTALAAGRGPHPIAVAGRGDAGAAGGLHAAALSAMELWDDYQMGVVEHVPINLGLVTLQLTLPMFLLLITCAFVGVVTLVVLVLCGLAAMVGELTRPFGGFPARGPPPGALPARGGKILARTKVLMAVPRG